MKFELIILLPVNLFKGSFEEAVCIIFLLIHRQHLIFLLITVCSINVGYAVKTSVFLKFERNLRVNDFT